MTRKDAEMLMGGGNGRRHGLNYGNLLFGTLAKLASV